MPRSVWMVRYHQEEETRVDLRLRDPLAWSEQDFSAFRKRLHAGIEAVLGRGDRRRCG